MALSRADAVLEAARSGDRDALGQLLRRLLPRIRRTLARYVGTGPDLDDCTQEVLMAVARGLPAFRGEASVETWVHRICIRAAGSRRRAAAELIPLGAAPARAGTGDGERAVMLDGLAAAVDALPPDRRTVFVMCDVEGYTGAEVAAELGVPRGTVVDRLRQARLQLRRALGAWRER